MDWKRYVAIGIVFGCLGGLKMTDEFRKERESREAIKAYDADCLKKSNELLAIKATASEALKLRREILEYREIIIADPDKLDGTISDKTDMKWVAISNHDRDYSRLNSLLKDPIILEAYSHVTDPDRERLVYQPPTQYLAKRYSGISIGLIGVSYAGFGLGKRIKDRRRKA